MLQNFQNLYMSIFFFTFCCCKHRACELLKLYTAENLSPMYVMLGCSCTIDLSGCFDDFHLQKCLLQHLGMDGHTCIWCHTPGSLLHLGGFMCQYHLCGTTQDDQAAESCRDMMVDTCFIADLSRPGSRQCTIWNGIWVQRRLGSSEREAIRFDARQKDLFEPTTLCFLTTQSHVHK